MEKELERLWLRSGGDKEKFPYIRNPGAPMVISEEVGLAIISFFSGQGRENEPSVLRR